jgi:hypothetical protein
MENYMLHQSSLSNTLDPLVCEDISVRLDIFSFGHGFPSCVHSYRTSKVKLILSEGFNVYLMLHVSSRWTTTWRGTLVGLV